MNAKTQTAFDRAKVNLISRPNAVFFSTILFSLRHRWNSTIPTAGVDGINLFINPNWFMSLQENERVGLLVHEVMHVVYQHMLRGEHKDKEKYNQAADYVINLELQDQGYVLPQGGLIDEQYRDMSTEQVYDLLPDKPSGSPDYDCDIKVPEDGEGEGKGSGSISDSSRIKIGNILIKAAIQSKAQGDKAGTIPGEAQRLIEDMINPKIPWSTLLQNYFSQYSKDDYSFKKPNRRYMPEWYLPSLYSESIADLAFAIDTSGSVTDEEFNAIRSEIHSVRETMHPKNTIIVDFDSDIKNVHELDENQSIDDVVFTGYGGTNLYPVFEHFNKNPPTVLIVFSDLHCKQIMDTPEYDVLWICVNNSSAKVNFGTLIHYETD